VLATIPIPIKILDGSIPIGLTVGILAAHSPGM
jgi:hypothetical protein